MNTIETSVGAYVKPTKKLYKRSTKRMTFYILAMALPILQLAIFYVYINFNSFLLAFKNYTDYIHTEYAGFDNFKWAFEKLGESGSMFKVSLINYAVNLFLGLGLSIIFSYYLSKKYWASGMFKTVLFMPQILSVAVLAVLYKYIVTDVYSIVTETLTGIDDVPGLLDNSDTALGTIIFFNVWTTFGAQVLMFTGAMSGINDSIVEAAHLDGATVMQEFFYITIPMIWPTFVTYFVTGLAGIFNNQMNLYTFYPGGTPFHGMDTMGYYLFFTMQDSDVFAPKNGITYSQISALGLILTFMVLPLTLGARKLLETFGPRTD